MLFVHPLYAEADERDNVGQLHFVDGDSHEASIEFLIDAGLPLEGRDPSAAVFHQSWQGEDFLLAMLLPAGSQAGMLRYPQTATAVPLLIALGLVGLMFSVAIVLLQRRAFP